MFDGKAESAPIVLLALLIGAKQLGQQRDVPLSIHVHYAARVLRPNA